MQRSMLYYIIKGILKSLDFIYDLTVFLMFIIPYGIICFIVWCEEQAEKFK